jgi:rubrerythrin
MEDAWLDLRGLLEAGLKYEGLTREELISGAIEGIHYTNIEHSEGTKDYLYKRQQNQQRVERCKAAGVCVKCGAPVEPEHALCPVCREKRRIYREKQAAAGREVAGT